MPKIVIIKTETIAKNCSLQTLIHQETFTGFTQKQTKQNLTLLQHSQNEVKVLVTSYSFPYHDHKVILIYVMD